MWKQASAIIVLLLGSCLAQDYSVQDYATEDHAARAQHLAPNYVHHAHDPHLYDHAKAEPYDFGFQSTDEFGTVMNRQEASDNNGAVRGSYGYTDPNGVFRHVDYVADEYGFRAQVKSNEPGMGSQSPANVEIYAEPPPAGVVIDRPYHHHHPSNPVPSQHRHQPGGRLAGSVAAATSSNPTRQVRPVQAPASSTIRNPTASASSSASANRGAGVGPFTFVPSRHNPYPSTVTNSQEYPQTVSRYGGPNPYPPRSNYGQGVASAQQSSSAITSSSSTTSSQATATGAQTGYRYPVGNPHISNFVKSDDETVEGGSIVLPTIVASGAPTLVKHIHTYPVAV